MFEKHLWQSNILSKDAGQWPASLLKMSLFHRKSLPLKMSLFHLKCHSSKHFASKNQLPGLSVSGTLVENGLLKELPERIWAFIFDERQTRYIQIQIIHIMNIWIDKQWKYFLINKLLDVVRRSSQELL